MWFSSVNHDNMNTESCVILKYTVKSIGGMTPEMNGWCTSISTINPMIHSMHVINDKANCACHPSNTHIHTIASHAA